MRLGGARRPREGELTIRTCPLPLQHAGDSSTSQSEVDKSTVDTLAQITSSFEQHRDEVVAQLLERVVQVQPTLHRNFKATA